MAGVSLNAIGVFMSTRFRHSDEHDADRTRRDRYDRRLRRRGVRGARQRLRCRMFLVVTITITVAVLTLAQPATEESAADRQSPIGPFPLDGTRSAEWWFCGSWPSCGSNSLTPNNVENSTMYLRPRVTKTPPDGADPAIAFDHRAADLVSSLDGGDDHAPHLAAEFPKLGQPHEAASWPSRWTWMPSGLARAAHLRHARRDSHQHGPRPSTKTSRLRRSLYRPLINRMPAKNASL